MALHKKRSLILYIFFHYHILLLTSCMLSTKTTKRLLKEAEENGPYDLIIVPGIPCENIFTETKAEHSTENIYYSYHKAKKLNFNHIALATDPFQTKMLRKFVRKKVSKDVDCIPMVFDTLKAMEPTMIDPIINFDSLKVKDFQSLPEKQGFWKRLRGTRGLNIDKKAYE